jgi:hypothetical protein
MRIGLLPQVAMSGALMDAAAGTPRLGPGPLDAPTCLIEPDMTRPDDLRR